jgi:uncharacterized protein (TIGR00730 family)
VRITVFCGSSRAARDPHLEAARQLGAELARRGHVLVYGGGRTGLMGALADAALAAGGEVRGVILRKFIEMELHHEGVSMQSVGDMRSRKAGLDALADAFVALPGGFGTLEELTEILSLRKLRHHERRVVLLDAAGYFDPFLAQLERAIAEGFEAPESRAFFSVARDAGRALDLCEAARPRRACASPPQSDATSISKGSA